MEGLAVTGFILVGVVLGYVIGYMANPLVAMYRDTIKQLRADNKSLRNELDKVYYEYKDEKEDTDMIPDDVINSILEKLGIEMDVEEAKRYLAMAKKFF